MLDAEADTVDEVDDLISGILSYNKDKSGCDSIQEWIDGELAENAGSGSEWYIIGLRCSGEAYDFSKYAAALSEYLAENSVSSAVSRQKYAVALMAAGDDDNEYIRRTAEDSTGKQGIMSWVYGLHLANNGISADGCYITDMLISMQLDDGGWALTGSHGDVDVTAMTIQALAPHYNDENVKKSIDGALEFLSEKQLDDGDYSSFGVENPESPCQVITALSALGIDCMKDERFIKNGSTLIDGIAKYRLPDGSFSHVLGGESSEFATVQAFYSLTAHKRMCSIYIFENDDAKENNSASNPILYVQLAVSAAGIILCAVLLSLKKLKIRYCIPIIAFSGIIILLISFADARDNRNRISSGTVTVTIRCDTVADKPKINEYIPDDGVILAESEMPIYDGYTVFDVLSDAAKKYNIPVEHDGSVSKYVSGINCLYQFDYGELSGWIYHVNGIRAGVSCSDYKVCDGDKIEWLYTCDSGDDLKE